MSSTGRPRKRLGTIFKRSNSRHWWVRYRDQRGRIVKESSKSEDREAAERFLRDRLDSRDDGTLSAILAGKVLTFDMWADWFLERRSKPPYRSEKTHHDNLEVLKNLRPVFGRMRLQDITAEAIEAYLRERLDSKRRVRTHYGYRELGTLKPATVHKDFRVLRRILSVAVQQRVLGSNPCRAVEFPARLTGTTRKPHYLTASEQERIELFAPTYLRHIVVIMVEMGLRPYKELLCMQKFQVDLDNDVVHIPDSKTPGGIADMPVTSEAKKAIQAQWRESGESPYLFPSITPGASKPHLSNVNKAWTATLRRAKVPHFSLYELRHTFATRLSAGGVADHFVAQALRQDDSAVFKRYSQAKLEMLREALGRLDRQANERGKSFGTPTRN